MVDEGGRTARNPFEGLDVRHYTPSVTTETQNTSLPPTPRYATPLKRRLGAFAVGVCLTLLFIFMITRSSTATAGSLFDFLGWPFAIVFGLATLAMAKGLILRRPVLAATATGMALNGRREIPWSDIASLRIGETRTQRRPARYLEVVLHDPERYIAERAPRLQRALGAGRGSGHGPAIVLESVLPVPAESALSEILRFHAALPRS